MLVKMPITIGVWVSGCWLVAAAVSLNHCRKPPPRANNGPWTGRALRLVALQDHNLLR
jgi:hypothetical protein